MQQKRLTISVPAAAELLGISKPMAYMLANTDPDFPAFKIGGRLVVYEAGLEKWVKKQVGEEEGE